MTAKQRLGELLIDQGLVPQEAIEDALRVQTGGNRRLGHILVRMGVLSEDQLAETLAQQLGISVTCVEEYYSSEVKTSLPRYLCRKYSVIPLSFDKNNILRLAMADPSDQSAIEDIEHYTSKVVEPFLAKHSEINYEIKNRIPYSLKDLFSPQAGTLLTRTIAVAAFALVVVLGTVTYDYIKTARYGTVSHVNNSIIYKHHDLMLGFEPSGKISLLGRSAFSDGYYSVSFNSPDTLRAFITSRHEDFSDEQKKWLDWALSNAGISDRAGKGIATTSQ